ncbi:MAG: hypothetical protein ACM3H7_04565, partial [Acidobacteriaceae bacterium]
MLLLSAASPLFVSGCASFTDYEASQEYTSDAVGVVDGLNDVGQTIVSRRPLLNGITIWLTASTGEDEDTSTGKQNLLTVRLFHSLEDPSPIFTSTIVVPNTGRYQPVYIKLSGTENRAGQAYFLQLTKKIGSIQVNGRNEDVYPSGQAYVNRKPIQADIAFRLSYDYRLTTLAQDIGNGISALWLAVPLLILLWLPGWLILDISGWHNQLDYGEQTGMSIAISLALTPVIMLWTTLAHFKWTRSSVLFGAGFLVALFLLRLVYKRIISRPPTRLP